MGIFWGVDHHKMVGLLKKLFFDDFDPPKPAGKSSLSVLAHHRNRSGVVDLVGREPLMFARVENGVTKLIKLCQIFRRKNIGKTQFWPRVCKNVHLVTKSRPRVSKNTKRCIILIFLFTKFRTDSLDHMRRSSNVVLRKKNNKKMTIPYKPAKLPRSLKQLPPIRRALR